MCHSFAVLLRYFVFAEDTCLLFYANSCSILHVMTSCLYIFLIGPGVSKFMSAILFYLNNRAMSGRYMVEIQLILPKTPNKPNHLYDFYVHININ